MYLGSILLEGTNLIRYDANTVGNGTFLIKVLKPTEPERDIKMSFA